MKKFTVNIATAFLVCWLTISSAVAGPASTGTSPQPKVIWDYQSELQLTDGQVKALQAAVGDLQDQLIGLQARNRVPRQQLREMIDQRAPLPLIRTKLREVMGVDLEMRMLDIEAARQIETVLTKAQLEKWHAIQKEKRAANQTSPRASQ